METTVTTKNMVTIPKMIARKLGIRPGWKLDWREGVKPDEVIVRVIPDRAELGRRLLGSGKALAPGRDAVAELVSDREVQR